MTHVHVQTEGIKASTQQCFAEILLAMVVARVGLHCSSPVFVRCQMSGAAVIVLVSSI